MKITTRTCTAGLRLPVDFGMYGSRLRQIDVPVSAVRLGWGADHAVRNADAVVNAVKPTPVVQAPVPLSRLRARSLT